MYNFNQGMKKWGYSTPVPKWVCTVQVPLVPQIMPIAGEATLVILVCINARVISDLH